ncbi:MAG: hypothetical protein FWD97_01735 [Defluviitaleaceae bacterium]|nr:hypothetical protein [Defluviitaleaceae bacterium]
MTKIYAEMLWNLKKHFDRCFDEYMDGVLKLDKQAIIDTSSEIAAVKEVHCEMTFWLVMSMSSGTKWPNELIKQPIEEQDVIHLLYLENPLKMLADKFWVYTVGNKADFQEFYSEVILKVPTEKEVGDTSSDGNACLSEVGNKSVNASRGEGKCKSESEGCSLCVKRK